MLSLIETKSITTFTVNRLKGRDCQTDLKRSKFPGDASGTEPAWQCRRCERCRFNPWVGKIPWRRERLPTPVFWPGEFHGVYSPCGRKDGHD